MPKLPQNFSVKKAHEMQVRLSKLVIHEDVMPETIRLVGGVDVHYVGDLAVGAAAVLDYNSLEVIETSAAVCPVSMPYVPTLLSFREIPPALAAIGRLKVQPAVWLVDAQGWAHPYRCGFASHLGLALKKPTVGSAKRRLTGKPTEVEGRTLLLDKGEVVGEELTTRPGAKPIYVSVGHMVTLSTATEIVRHTSKIRIPEPLRFAHNLAAQTRQKLAEKQSKYPQKE